MNLLGPKRSKQGDQGISLPDGATTLDLLVYLLSPLAREHIPPEVTIGGSPRRMAKEATFPGYAAGNSVADR